MNIKNLILLVICLLSGELNANSPRKLPLFALLKDNHLCVFTQDDKAELGYQNRAYIYTTNLDEKASRSNDYEKIYYNIKVPISLEDCVLIPLASLERDKPHDIFIELDKTYSMRVCISKENQVYKVGQSQQCSHELYDFKDDNNKSFFSKVITSIKEYVLDLFARIFSTQNLKYEKNLS